MNDRWRLSNARVVTPDAILAGGNLEIRNGKIAAITQDPPDNAADCDFDARGRLLVPGFIDTHFHGCLGRDLMELDSEHWTDTSRFLAAHGVTGFLPTCTSAPAQAMADFLKFAEERRSGMPGAAVLGVHLEGPYLNPEYAGMMPPGCLRNPDPGEYAGWFRSGLVLRMTAALELPGSKDLVADSKDAGVLLSLGHTVCAADDVRRWADAGLCHVTHLYNAMSRAEKRGPTRWCGCLEGALADPRVSVEIIGDGFHVPEYLFRIAALCKGADGMTVASDSTPATGAVSEGERIRYGGETGKELVVRKRMALSVDEKYLVGSICPMGDMFARIREWMGNDVTGAAKTFSTNIADLLGLGARKGRIQVGYDADMVLLDEQFNVAATWVGGQRVFET